MYTWKFSMATAYIPTGHAMQPGHSRHRQVDCETCCACGCSAHANCGGTRWHVPSRWGHGGFGVCLNMLPLFPQGCFETIASSLNTVTGNHSKRIPFQWLLVRFHQVLGGFPNDLQIVGMGWSHHSILYICLYIVIYICGDRSKGPCKEF